MNTSRNNKHLIVQASVVLTDSIDPVITALDAFFERAGKKAIVTSGYRDAANQLQVVRQYLVKKQIANHFPEAMNCQVADKIPGTDRYAWQMAWSKLLNIGVIINPPLAAPCLLDYIRNGVNKKGQLIGASPHSRGTAFDIGGGANGIQDELSVIQGAIASGQVPGLIHILPERENNALHCDCKLIA